MGQLPGYLRRAGTCVAGVEWRKGLWGGREGGGWDNVEGSYGARVEYCPHRRRISGAPKRVEYVTEYRARIKLQEDVELLA